MKGVLDREKLGAALQKSRTLYGWSLREAERHTGVGKSIIARAERGHADGYVTADAVLILGYYYGLDPRAFVTFHVDTPSGQLAPDVSEGARVHG